MGATPDGIVKCDCCGNGVVEIKCPYSAKNKALCALIEEHAFFLEQLGTVTALKKDHAYYFQVQAQMKFCNARYCDFVVWSPNDFFVEGIYPDVNFMDSAIEKVSVFIKVGVLPELLGKWYSKENQSVILSLENKDAGEESSENVGCYCRDKEDGKMIACNNKDCAIQWFHTTCLRITKLALGKWFCPDCRKIQKKR